MTKLPAAAKAWELAHDVQKQVVVNVGQPPLKLSPYAVKVW